MSKPIHCQCSFIDGRDDIQHIKCPLCASAPALLEACKELTVAILAIRVRLQKPSDEREQKAVDELYRLFAKGKAAIAAAVANEASGFLALSDIERHGVTNSRVLRLRIEEAHDAIVEAEAR